jgi:hypothetical protein
MSNGGSTNKWYVALATVVGVGLLFWFFCTVCGGGNEGKEALALAKKIDAYLGTNQGAAPHPGLVGNIEDNNAFHREQYDKIGCALAKLEAKVNGTPPPPPDKCPEGGGTTQPISPPKYP